MKHEQAIFDVLYDHAQTPSERLILAAWRRAHPDLLSLTLALHDGLLYDHWPWTNQPVPCPMLERRRVADKLGKEGRRMQQRYCTLPALHETPCELGEWRTT